MFDGLWDKISMPVIGIGLWAGSLEKRLWGKVNVRECDAKHKHTDKQLNRLESHLWDVMKAMKIEPSVEPPEEIKRLNNRESN